MPQMSYHMQLYQAFQTKYARPVSDTRVRQERLLPSRMLMWHLNYGGHGCEPCRPVKAPCRAIIYQIRASERLHLLRRWPLSAVLRVRVLTRFALIAMAIPAPIVFAFPALLLLLRHFGHDCFA